MLLTKEQDDLDSALDLLEAECRSARINTSSSSDSKTQICNDVCKNASSDAKNDVQVASIDTSSSDTVSKLVESFGGKKEHILDELKEELNIDENDLDSLMAQFGNCSEENLFGLLDSLADQLITKELLYQPMLQLHSRLQNWLAKEKKTLKTQQLQSYKLQLDCIQQVLSIFQDPSYNVSNKQQTINIKQCITRLQEAGNLPQELLAALGAGQDSPCTIA